MRRLLAIVVVVAVAAGGFVLSGASDSGGKRRYRIVLDNAFGLVEGGDFRVGGVRAGKTTTFDIQKQRGHAPKAVVTAEVSEPGFDDFRSDASCEVKPQSLIGEYYVDCQPGSSGKRLPTDGSGTVPVKQTASTIPTDLVNNIMRRPYRERFRFVINELGTGLAGRPQDLQQVLRRAHPGLRETTRVLRILAGQNRVIENFIRDSDTVIGELNGNRRDVVRWVKEAGDASEISASRSQAIREGFRRLPTFLAELRPTMARLENLIDAQQPLLGELRRAAPSLTTLFTRLGPFARASRPALSSLGQASEAGSQAFRKGSPEVNELVRLAPQAPPTFKPLRQWFQSMDDRKRALEDDVRAKNSAPPSPDPTAISGSGGFTGLEAPWDYFFWQTLSLNGVDSVGHYLRNGLTANDCSPQRNSPPQPGNAADKRLFDKCNSWMGPDQPGVTTADFTRSPSRLRRLQRESGRSAARLGERRQPGQPEAGPRPGQRDISKPQVVLPPGVKNLLKRLAPKDRPRLPRTSTPSDPPSADRFLDFLLGP